MRLQTAGLSGCFLSRCLPASPPPPPSPPSFSLSIEYSTFWKLETKLKRERERARTCFCLACFLSELGNLWSCQGNFSQGYIALPCSAHAAQPESP